MFRLSPPRLCYAMAFALFLCARMSAGVWDLAVARQTFTTKTFGVDSGLPSNVVQAIQQTQDGFLWFGTEAGLARFDGAQFRVFKNREFPDLADNLVRCLMEDRDGALWIGTQAGLSVYRKGKFERVGGLAAPIGALSQHPDGSVWIGTVGAGVWQFKDGTLLQRADGELIKRTDAILRVLAESSGRVWLSGENERLFWVENDRVTVPPRKEIAELTAVNRLLEAPRGTLWLAARNKLYRFRDDTLVRFGTQVDNGGDLITGLSEDRDGRIWICSGGALWMAENPEIDAFVRIPMTEVEYARGILQDREGTYWIASSGDGLARMRQTAFRTVTDPQRIPLRRARSVALDANGYVWAAFGVEPRGVARVAPDGTMSFVSLGDGPDGDVVTLCAGPDGEVWMGTRGSLARWKNGVIERFPDYRYVRVLFRSRDGTMWIGPSMRGVVRHRDGAFKAVNVPDEFRRATTSAMADGPGNSVYMGFVVNGILRVDASGEMVVNVSDGLPSLEIRAIHFDVEGRMWVGFRRHGLGVYLDGSWKNPEGLMQPFGERVTGIEEDGSGNLWLGTARGIMWALKEDFIEVARGAHSQGRFRVAGLAEGIGGGAVGTGTQPAIMKGPDGSLWFATREGLVAVQPGSVPLNSVPPPVRIESVTVDGKSTTPDRELRLPAGVRSLAIDYTALAFVQPERVFFRYRLSGSDHDWVEAGTRRTAFYTSLAPGRYVFQVIACNEDGVWNDVGARLAIVQSPSVYQTWWFWALAGGILISGGLGAYAWRTAALRRLVAKQTAQIRKQMQNESQLRSELERKARLESLGVLAGGIAHDFNNLLTVVIANVELASLSSQVRSVAGNYLQAAERGAHRAAELTQQLLTFAKGGEPVCRAVALPDVVREAAEFARHGTQVRCDIEVEDGLPAANADRAQISRVVHNLVLNSTQSMPEGGVITIRLSSADAKSGDALPVGRYIVLSISDQGCGIDPEHLPHIFDPYFSTKPKNHGLGLATVHSIVQRHHGKVTVESQVGKGSTFHVWLPVARETPEVPPQERPHIKPAAVPLRVLFMDDEESIRSVGDGFLRHLGHEPVLVKDGADAVREYEAALKAGRRFDVVILDLTVPGGMGGKAAIDALGRIDPEVRAIVSSGYSSDPVLANFDSFGFSCVVPKPYRIEELAAAIQQVLGGRNR